MTQDEYLNRYKAWNWRWPDDKGRWNTKQPKVKCPKKCNFTPLPGSANGRNSRKRRALAHKRADNAQG